MSTTDKPSRSYRIQTSSGEVMVIVHAEPNHTDVEQTRELFDMIIRDMLVRLTHTVAKTY